MASKSSNIGYTVLTSAEEDEDVPINRGASPNQNQNHNHQDSHSVNNTVGVDRTYGTTLGLPGSQDLEREYVGNTNIFTCNNSHK